MKLITVLFLVLTMLTFVSCSNKNYVYTIAIKDIIAFCILVVIILIATFQVLIKELIGWFKEKFRK